MSKRGRAACLSGYAAITFLSFPHPVPGLGPIDLGLFVAWLGPALLMLGCDGLVPRRAFGAGSTPHP